MGNQASDRSNISATCSQHLRHVYNSLRLWKRLYVSPTSITSRSQQTYDWYQQKCCNAHNKAGIPATTGAAESVQHYSDYLRRISIKQLLVWPTLKKIKLLTINAKSSGPTKDTVVGPAPPTPNNVTTPWQQVHKIYVRATITVSQHVYDKFPTRWFIWKQDLFNVTITAHSLR